MGKKEVASAVVIKDQQFLILQRSKKTSGAGTWNFPGGGVEKDEATDVAAARELYEEAGLKVDPKGLDYLGTLEGKGLIIHFYITRVSEAEVKINHESDDFQWVSLDGLLKYNFVGSGQINNNLYQKIKEYLNER